MIALFHPSNIGEKRRTCHVDFKIIAIKMQQKCLIAAPQGGLMVPYIDLIEFSENRDKEFKLGLIFLQSG